MIGMLFQYIRSWQCYTTLILKSVCGHDQCSLILETSVPKIFLIDLSGLLAAREDMVLLESSLILLDAHVFTV